MSLLTTFAVHELPPAGQHRSRALFPRELMAKYGTGSIHPANDEVPQMPEPTRGVPGMQLTRGVQHLMHSSSAPALRASSFNPMGTTEYYAAVTHETGMTGSQQLAHHYDLLDHQTYAPHAGLQSTSQIAKTRSEYKEQSIFGQFAGTPLQKSASSRLLNSIRNNNFVYNPHHKQMVALRVEKLRDRTRSGGR
jgi:hypothetical protein